MKQGARFAHISDLHIGRGIENDANAARLCTALLAFGIDQVIATGDLTHRGLERELATFDSIFAPLAAQGRLIVVPGNHDCLGDDVSGRLMIGPRVQTEIRPGLYVVRVNSTAPHNRSWINGHGSLDDADLDAIDAALDAAPAGVLVVIALHHHVLPMPEEHVAERLSNWLGFAFTSELRKGRELLRRVRGRCDLVLHGHRHIPRGARLFGDPRPVHVFNAGSSTEMARVRVFHHDGAGQLLGTPLWLDVPPPWDDAARAFDAESPHGGGENQFPAPLAV
ncbi:MAG TPA: metallophosphoesterase [Polyangia bacterium]|nr:metallophosphoesterase [Polyangia bacterium]